MADVQSKYALERIRAKSSCWGTDIWACSGRPVGHADIVADVTKDIYGETSYLYGCSDLGEVAMPCNKCKKQANVSQYCACTHLFCYSFLFPFSICWNGSAAKKRTDLITLPAAQKLYRLRGDIIPLVHESAGSAIIPDGVKMRVVDWRHGRWEQVNIELTKPLTLVVPINVSVERRDHNK